MRSRGRMLASCGPLLRLSSQPGHAIEPGGQLAVDIERPFGRARLGVELEPAVGAAAAPAVGRREHQPDRAGRALDADPAAGPGVVGFGGVGAAQFYPSHEGLLGRQAGPHDMDHGADGARGSGAVVGEAVSQQASQFEAGLLALGLGVVRALVPAGLAFQGRRDERIARLAQLQLQGAGRSELGHVGLRWVPRAGGGQCSGSTP
mmetsp:Transcript_17030/g.40615  ORF Transcript_17030/g.40615 Transcript_17030/m.40615 type:complete len:205 (+) Transcript_17030:3138-3752(+)